MTSGKQSRAERAAKIAAVTPKESRARLIAGILVAVLVVAGIGVAIWAGVRNSGDTDGQAPAGATGPDGGIVLSPSATLKADAPTLDVYQDFQCPHCHDSHAMFGPTMAALADAGDVKVVVHMKNFMEKQAPGVRAKGSTRPANATACAADVGKFREYESAVFAEQQEAQNGFPDEALERFAGKAGITGEALDTWRQCVKDGRYNGYIERVDEASAKAGVNGTPAYLVNGTSLDLEKLTDPQAFRQAITAAAAGSGSATK